MLESEKSAWLAALIDGEGCISLYVKYLGSTLVLAPMLTVVNKNIEILKRAKEYVGAGHIGSPETQKCARYVADFKVAINLIRRVLPYLVVKRPQAELVLEWYQYRQKQNFARYTERDVQAIQQIHLMNSGKPPAGALYEAWVREIKSAG